MNASCIYRNPPWIAGPHVLMAQDLEDVVDWGQAAHKLKELWPLGTGKGVLVGVCDTGRPTHSDLVDKIKHSKNFSSSFTDQDAQGHSTHVCGTIAAAKNGKGVVGVAHEAELVIAKVLGDDGTGDNEQVAKGVDYCIEKGCDIISMSLGGGFDPVIVEAIKRAVTANRFVVCAAGNDGKRGEQNTVNWPARMDEVVAVASYNKNGQISNFSSRGPEVDVAFPGEDILSCWLDDKYRRISGTSMATPFASGTVAMLLSHQRELEKSGAVENPVRNNFDLLKRFKEVANDQGTPGFDNDWGWGVVDVAKLLNLQVNKSTTTTVPPLVTTPGAPSELALGPFHAKVIVHEGHSGLFLYLG